MPSTAWRRSCGTRASRVLAGLELRKHFRAGATLRDARRLTVRLRRDRFDVVHCHLLADHLIAAVALRSLDPAERPVLVRTLYDAAAPRRGWRAWLAFGATDGVVAPTERVGEQVRERFGLPVDRVLVQDPPTEPERVAAGADLRERLGLAPGDFAIGITARIQPHRRFDLLWDVARRVADARPHVRFVLLGRGNARDVERLVTRPIERLRLGAHARLPGYLHDPDYTGALRSLDAFVFLVPGSDGTCRALREAMALGLPVVATPRGMLPDLLGEHRDLAGTGPAGLVVAEDPRALADALIALIDDPDARRRLGAAALARVRGPMHPTAANERLLALYDRCRERGVA